MGKSKWVQYPLAIAALLLLVQCQERGDFNPAGPDVHLVIISELKADPNQLKVNGHRSIISGRVIDQNEDSFVGTEVTFSALRGSITSSDNTDSDGRFSVAYLSGSEAGKDTITVSVLDQYAYVYLTLLGAPAGISLSTSSSLALANGIDTVRVTAALEGGDMSLENIPIMFTTTAGGFDGQDTIFVVTNENGQASALLIAPSSESTLLAEVTAYFEDNTPEDTTENSGLPAVSSPNFKQLRSLSRTSSGDGTASVIITFMGVMVNVEASPLLILGDGQATSEIRVYVKDATRRAIEGAEISFSADLGSIPATAVTDYTGLARVTLTSAERPGETDLIIARYGPVLADSINVEYAAIVTDLSLSADLSEIQADGISSCMITATVTGGTGKPASDIPVSFSSDLGILEPESGVTDDGGCVEVRFISPASKVDRTITVRAEVVEASLCSAMKPPRTIREIEKNKLTAVDRIVRRIGQSSTVQRKDRNARAVRNTAQQRHFASMASTIADTISITARGIQLQLSVDEDTLIARRGSSASVTAVVFETTSQNPVTDGTVYFTATQGLGTIPRFGILDADGHCEVIFSALEDTGLAQIQAQYGTMHKDSIGIRMLPKIGRLYTNPEQRSILAGGIDETKINIQVIDPLGDPAPQVSIIYEVDFEGEQHLIRTDEDGRAQFTVSSPPVEVDTIMIVSITAGHLLEEVNIGIRAVSRRITATPDSISAGSPEPVYIDYQAFETTSRRPVIGDSVWFSGMGGNVSPTGVLDSAGHAYTTLMVDEQPGTAWVFGRLGELKTDSVRIELVEAVGRMELSAGRESILASGIDTTAIVARVTNIVNDPTPDIWVHFEVDEEDVEIYPQAALTDEDGLAEIILRSSSLTDDNMIVNVHAVAVPPEQAADFEGGDPLTALIPQQETRGPLRTVRKATTRDYSGDRAWKHLKPVRAARRDSAEADLEVELRAVTLDLRTNPASIRADGESKVGVNVHLYETVNGRAVSGAEIRLGASMGSIRESGITQVDGTLTDSLTAGVEPGICEVRASYGDEISSIANVTFTPDPNRLNVIFTLDPVEVPADGETEVTLQARVVNNGGAPVENMDVVFTMDGALTVLVDTDEHRDVTHWENTFRVDEPDSVDGIRIRFQHRGIDSENTLISVNRNEIEDISLVQDELWTETVLELPSDYIQAGLNRISINGGDDGGGIDRFSVAGVRLGLSGRFPLAEEATDENGRAEYIFTADQTAGVLNFKAELTENPNAYGMRRLLLSPDDPEHVLISAEHDTLIANGIEDCEALVMVTDVSGNPVGDGHRVEFTLEGDGEIEPQVASTLADGTVLTRFTSPVVEDEDETTTLTAECDGVENDWTLLLRAPALDLTMPDDRILADGTSQMTVRARLGTNDGAPVVGRRIDFATTSGAITAVDITDDNGFVEAILIAGDEPDTATVTVSFGPNITEEVEVIFAPLVASIEMTASPRTFLGSGSDSTVITVTAIDGIDNEAPGIRIGLTTELGMLSEERVITDEDGTAIVVLTCNAIAEDDTIQVDAEHIGGNVTGSLQVRVRGINISVRADADSLSGNGVSTAGIIARVVEATSGVPVENGRINFATNLGRITGGANLSEDGIAEATYTAPLGNGTATITARFGDGLSAETDIRIVERASEIELEIDPGSILANGLRSADVIACVTDSWGDPAPRERIEINFEGAGDVTPLVGLTDQDGIFRAVAIGDASNEDSELQITASARDGGIDETETLELLGVNLSLSASPRLIRGDGESTSTITADVRESTSGHAVSGDTVRFTSTAGVIQAYEILDRTGRAITELRSDDEAAIATVTASFGDGLVAEVDVAFASRFSYLEAELGRERLLADGLDSTAIAATLRDTLGYPVEGVYIHYEITDGEGELSLDSSATDANGTANAVFYSAALEDDATTDIRVYADELEDILTTEMRGITIRVSAEADSLPANGYAETAVTAAVSQTTSGNPITDGTVSFSVDAGMIGETGELDENGAATVTLRAPEDPGEATVRASFGNTLSAEAEVVFVRTVESLELAVEEDRLLGDGLASVVVIARVLDEIDDPASDVRVHFSTPNGGEVEPAVAVSDENGYARTRYTGFATRADSTVTIEADTEADAQSAVSLDLIGISAELSASPSTLPANGRSTSTVTFRGYETTSHTPLIGYAVVFSADRGRIGRTCELDTSGIGSVTFTAPMEAGNAEIRAVIGDTLLTILNLPCVEALPANAQLSVEPEEIYVSGGGGEHSATVTARISDADQEQIHDSYTVTFTITNDIGVRFEDDQDSIDVDTEDGYARASVTAGEETGSVRFEVLYEGESLATGGELRVLAGPAARVNVHADLGTIHHPSGGLTAFPVSATVADRFSNPVEDSTVVRFYLVPDDLANITAVGYTNGGVVATPINPVNYPRGVWVTYSDEDAGEEIWIHATGDDGNAHDSTRVILPGAVEGGDPASMELSSDDQSLEADGTSSTTIQARIMDEDDHAVADMTEVRLTAVLGNVQSPRQTAGGEISSIYRAGRVAGIDTIRVTAGEISDMILITLRPGDPATIQLSVEDEEIRANGVQSTIVTAEVNDRFGNSAASDTQVEFTTELGEIDEMAVTNASGRATARLVSGVETGTSVISARSGDAYAQTSILFVSGEADGIVLHNIDRDFIGVRGSGAPETATLIFEVRDDRGVAVDNEHAAEVEFSINGPALLIDPEESSEDSVAYLEPETATTDDLGRVAVTLNSGYFAGAVEITASIGDDISGQAISVAIHGGPPDANHFSLSPARYIITGLEGTPVDTTMLWANVGDRFSNPTVPGTVVRFSSTGGVVTGSARTDELGNCRAILTSSRPAPEEGVDTVTAQTVDWQDREITTQAVVLVTGRTIISFDTTDGWRIPFGSFRNFTVNVADRYENPLVAGTSIFIEAEARDVDGEPVEGVILSGEATQEEYILPEFGQRADFQIRIFNYVNGLDAAQIIITATVESPNGDREATLNGFAVGQVLSTENSSVVLSPDEIIADGEDECNVNITLYDIRGISIPDVPPDEIEVTVDDGDPLITPPEEATDDEGRTRAVVVGREVGEGTVQVRVGEELLEDQPTLNFVAGSPERLLIQVLDRTLEVGGDTTTVVVDVRDQRGNPTPDGTMVFFETDDGRFTPASTQTRNGRALTVFSSGENAGQAVFTVTASHRGSVIEEEVTNIVLLPGPPASFNFTTDSYLVRVGSQNRVEIAGVDEFGNPVTQNTLFYLSVTPENNGSVAPDTVQADAEGKADVEFTAGETADETARIVVISGEARGLSSVFRFIPGHPGRIELSLDPDQEEVEVDEPVNISAEVEDAYGNHVADTTRVQFSTEPQVGTLSPRAVNTSDGIASARLSGVRVAGPLEVIVQAGEISASARIVFTVGELTRIEVTAEPNLVQFGRSSVITARATDRFGNPVADETLNFTLTTNPGGDCELQHDQRTTEDDGTASTIFTAANTVGSAIITVTWEVDEDVEGSTYVDIQNGGGGN